MIDDLKKEAAEILGTKAADLLFAEGRDPLATLPPVTYARVKAAVARVLYRAALAKWGLRAQVYTLAEEALELAHAAHKINRGLTVYDPISPEICHLAEEIADVEIMIAQICEAFELRGTIEREKDAKLARLAVNLGVAP